MKASQEAQILRHLKAGRSLSALNSLNLFGVLRFFMGSHIRLKEARP